MSGRAVMCGSEEERGTSVAGSCWCRYYVVVVVGRYWWWRRLGDRIGGGGAAGGAGGACNWCILVSWVRRRRRIA